MEWSLDDSQLNESIMNKIQGREIMFADDLGKALATDLDWHEHNNSANQKVL